MNADHDALRLALGAYVLGVLPPAEAERVRAHLAECDGCRAEHDELAGLPALLATVTAEEVEGIPVPVGDEDPADRLVRRAAESAGGPPPAPPGTSTVPGAPEAGLLERMMRQAAVRRRRTWRRQLAGAVASLMLVAGAAAGGTWLALSGSVAGQATPPAPVTPAPSRVFSGSDATTGVTATVWVAPSAWGSVLEISARGAPAGITCRLQAVGPGGTRADAATWRAGAYPVGTTVPGAVPLSPAAIEHFEIVAGNGQKLVTIRA
ncbi:zf-HC2 domain-containing protein [Streptomyces sp. NPDC048191]|uniref:zf-HC2 domain-containing protein n=1 Tax=Streptomyces sp. NPDC048191 TaxID=3155484 RepID=UPI0033D452BF